MNDTYSLDRDRLQPGTNQFAWTEFYEAFARKLLAYRHNRAPLIEGLQRLVQVQPLLTYLTNDENPPKKRIQLEDICPFTLMGGFNRGKVTPKNRAMIAGQLGQMIGIADVPPISFDGIPVINPQNSWFFSYSYRRKPEDIEKLWRVFESAIRLVDDESGATRKTFIEAYDDAIQVRSTSWNLSQGLYWILPWHYLTLDSQSRDYLESKLGIQILKRGESAPCSAKRYLELLEQLNGKFASSDFPIHDFPSLSLAAWNFESNTNEIFKQVDAVNDGTVTQGDGVSKNIIYYGPPGTGKTYTLMQLLKRDYERASAEMPSDEWRQQFIVGNFSHLKWWEVVAAALYEIGGKTGTAKVSDIAKHPFTQAVAAKKGARLGIIQNTLWRTLQYHTVEESTTVNVKERVTPAIFDKTETSHWRFAGDWQDDCAHLTELVDELKKGLKPIGSVKLYSFVTFHQSYGYEEFVEGLRPVLASGADESDVQYEIRSGVFKDVCDRARLAPDQRFAMVIDEINRGNISKIFGELITLIEADKREGGAHPVTVKLPYSGELFSVPANVDIIGTMNTADRSLALLDTALRRRFEFVPILPNVSDDSNAPLGGMRVHVDGEVINIPKMLAAINRRVEALYDHDHCIGHAYFTGLKHFADGPARLDALKEVFQSRIIPLLEEYFFEDWQKIRLVLADNQKPTSAQFITESPDHEDDLLELFGLDHGLDTFSTKRRFQKQGSALDNPSAYIGIYEALTD